jgi:3-phytase
MAGSKFIAAMVVASTSFAVFFQSPHATSSSKNQVPPTHERGAVVDAGVVTVPTTLRLLPDGAGDQDDMCVWVHPEDRSKSTIITADKDQQRVLVYGLDGNVIQTLPTPMPGNIDVRYSFELSGQHTDIVVFIQRALGDKILVYSVDATTRLLSRVDDNGILGPNGYGGALYRSPKTRKFFFVKTTKSVGEGGIEQIELFDNGRGQVSGKRVRQWDLEGCEGVVADDELSVLFVAQEDRGIWKVGAEPDDPTPGELLAEVEPGGLIADVEGLALYKTSDARGYLIASNQTANHFRIYERTEPHRFLGAFAVKNVIHTDGIDVCNVDLGPRFPQGLFACHTDQPANQAPSPVVVTPWESIANELGLEVDNSVNPRGP